LIFVHYNNPKRNKGHKINKEFTGNKLRYSLEISRLCQQLKMLSVSAKMPLEKKDKGKTWLRFPFILACLELNF